ncbi:hypothetical protein ARMGADRAFT_1070518 [Armillaria gallica]|uniref:Uncharacterized protein n=1 Tax=Armillaria gallica TaxID=47427 RepID=A0A2H3F083_ARMGA|nr:hypothetical protein ARMGADRAFT_1070518 [Armillaria gallica]
MSEQQSQQFNHLVDGLHQILGPSTSFGDSAMVMSQSFQAYQGYMHPGSMYASQSTPQFPYPPTYGQNFPSQFMFYPSVSNPYMNPFNDPSNTYQTVPPPHYIPTFPSQTTYQYRNNPLNTLQTGMQDTIPPPDRAPPIPSHPNCSPLPQPPPPPPPPPPNIPIPPAPAPPPPPNNVPNTAPPPYPHIQPNAPVQQYHNIQPQIQYIYLPTPHTNTLENNVPQTSHIPELKTQADWAAWYHGVQNLLMSRAIFTHICDPPALHIA